MLGPAVLQPCRGKSGAEGAGQQEHPHDFSEQVGSGSSVRGKKSSYHRYHCLYCQPGGCSAHATQLARNTDASTVGYRAKQRANGLRGNNMRGRKHSQLVFPPVAVASCADVAPQTLAPHRAVCSVTESVGLSDLPLEVDGKEVHDQCFRSLKRSEKAKCASWRAEERGG